MSRVGWWKSLAVPITLVLAIPVAAAPPEDKSALAQVPATSPLVVYVRGVEGAGSRAIVYLKNALPDLAPLAEVAFKQFLENGSQDRKLRGLAKDGPIFLAFSEMPKGDEPKVAAVVAVTDYKAFRDNLLNEEERKALRADPKGFDSASFDGKAIYFIDRKGYAVVTHDEKLAIAYTKKPIGFDTKISKEQATRLLTGDIGVYLSMDIVNKDYAEQIKEAKEQAETALKGAAEGLGKNQAGMMEALRSLIGPMFQAIEDSKGVLFTVEFRPTALVVHMQSELRPDTKTSTLLKPFKPFPAQELDKQPSGLVFYTGMMMNAEFMKLLGPMTVGASAEPGTKAAKAIQAALDEMIKAGPGARIDIAGLPASGVQTWKFAEPAKAAGAVQKILENLGTGDTFASGMLKQKAPLKKNAAKYGNIEFHSVTFVWDLEKMSGASGAELPEEVQKKMVEGFKKILGEQTTLWVGADDKQVINVTASDWKAAEALLDKHFKGGETIGQKSGYMEARKELAPGAMLVGMVDIVGYATAITEIVKPIIAGFGVNLPDKYPAALPKGNPSFIGTAVTLDEKRMGFEMVITSSAVRDIYKAFVVPLRGGF